MDDRRFDNLTLLLARGFGRRAFLRSVGVLAAAIAASVGIGSDTRAAAIKRSQGEICRKHGDCLSGYCGAPDRTGRRRCGCPADKMVCGDGSCRECCGDNDCEAYFERCCGGQCVNIFEDPLHCGGCDESCPAGGICLYATGEFFCQCSQSGYVVIDGVCSPPPPECTVDTDCLISGEICCANECVDGTSYRNCGACGNVCAVLGQCANTGATYECQCDQGETVVDGVCRGPAVSCAIDTDCQQGELCCANVCRNIYEDPDHCGACGAACPAGEWCIYATGDFFCQP